MCLINRLGNGIRSWHSGRCSLDANLDYDHRHDLDVFGFYELLPIPPPLMAQDATEEIVQIIIRRILFP